MDPTKIIEAALGNTPMETYIRKHPIFAKIIGGMPKIPFEDIKREEIYLHGDEYLLKDGKKEKDPYVSFSEKCVYINRVLSAVAESVGSGIVVMDGDLYYYDGCKWVNMSEQIASNFLSLIATKSGLYNSMVSDFKVKKNMFKQLSSDLIKQEITQESTSLRILINVKNGTLEVTESSCTLRDFSKDDFLRYQLGFEYDPCATSPMFDKFLDEVLPEKAAQDVLMEMIGYCFIPTQKIKLERSLLLHGPGANGKGVVFDIVVAIIGEEHISGFSMETLSNDPNARAQLKDKLLNYATELGGKCKPDMIKKLISGEPVDVKTLYKDVTMMQNYTCKFIFNTNTLPRGAENTNAFFRRWLILPFNAVISPEKKDIHLSKKLKTELPGIFNRVLAGVQRLVKNEDFTESKLAAQMLEEYKEQSNSVLRFIKEGNWVPTVSKNSTEKISSTVQHVSLTKFYENYKKYCTDSGCNVSSNVDFGKKIKEYFLVQRKRTNNETWVFAKQEMSLSIIPKDYSTADNSDDIINQIIADSDEKFKS